MKYVLIERYNPEDDDPIQVFAELGEDRREVRRLEFYSHGISFSYGRERGRDEALDPNPYPEDLSVLVEGQDAEAKEISAATFDAAWAQSGELPDGFLGIMGL